MVKSLLKGITFISIMSVCGVSTANPCQNKIEGLTPVSYLETTAPVKLYLERKDISLEAIVYKTFIVGDFTPYSESLNLLPGFGSLPSRIEGIWVNKKSENSYVWWVLNSGEAECHTDHGIVKFVPVD